jgi:hypothetical protein
MAHQAKNGAQYTLPTYAPLRVAGMLACGCPSITMWAVTHTWHSWAELGLPSSAARVQIQRFVSEYYGPPVAADLAHQQSS